MKKYITGLLVAAAVTIGAAPAQSAIVGVTPNADFSSLPYTVSLFGGASTYIFSALAFNPYDNLYRQDALATTGGATAYGGGFVGNGTDYTTYSAGSATPENNFGGDFIPAPTPRAIDYSVADTYVALAINDDAQTYYGYAELDGTSLIRLAYNSTPGGSITTGQAISAVPEPMTWAMMIGGFGAIGGIIRRARSEAETRVRRKVRSLANA